MSSKRLGRISEEVKKVVSSIIRNNLKDPRISPLTTITKVEVTRDLRYAKIYFGVLGKDSDKQKTLKGLENSKGYIRKGIGESLNLRFTPEPLFYLDESAEQGIYISKLIDKVTNEDKKKDSGDDE